MNIRNNKAMQCLQTSPSSVTESSKKKRKKQEREGEAMTEKKDKRDYIRVRARRGQATDSHSLAERVRREKIDKRMKCLQGLVPGCNEIMGKASVLDEIINYVQSLQSQIEFLSLKLAAADPGMHCISSEVLELNSSCNSRSIAGISLPAITDQLEFLQPASDLSGVHMVMNPQMTRLRNTIDTAPIQLHSCFNVLGSSAWDETSMNGFTGLEFDRGKDSELEKGEKLVIGRSRNTGPE